MENHYQQQQEKQHQENKDTNPIANISGLNIEVAGKKNIGLLRYKDYSENNPNDMILDTNTMGVFTFGNGAKDSTLIRTDKYGIQVKKRYHCYRKR